MSYISEPSLGQTKENFSRLSRSYRVGERRNHDRNFRVPSLHRFYLLLLSLVVSICSIAVPFLAGYANGWQSESLYTGVMMVKGQLPYSDVFATGGFFYYLLILVSDWLGSLFWLIPFQLIFFYTSGLYFYKIVYYLSVRRDVTLAFAFIFYLLQLLLGFGGLYPSQFGMPFVLIGIWFLLRYFAGIINDEAFVLYGFISAFALLFDPQSLVFWLLSFVTIGIYNISYKHFARGFYQLLCIIFGALLVIYTAGYFIFNLQILSPYINQAFIYPFISPAMGSDNFILAFILQLAVALGTGLLRGLSGIFQRKNHRFITILLGITAFIYFVLALLSSDYCLYHLLPLTIYGLILTASHFRDRSRRRSKNEGMFEVVITYIRRGFYLTALLVVIAIGHLGYRVLSMTSINHERLLTSHYLAKQTSGDDTIYAWDTVATIYTDSKLKTNSSFALPMVNTHNKTNQKNLVDSLLEADAAYIVVNKSMTLPKSVSNMLDKEYKAISVSNVKSFTLYQKK
ncbi:DUF2079 domain-containing protein [Streptococcus sciuri]|uniref:DUF2079 domain-containing protein n=1 Tax=Streptococcus sciuri TaxID=2973939 RepID=A0ABT2F7U3_9STRE|nr:DUF2079 domain-containing protein [Streptococcus sciuri]MCS4487917.1 DUF2079 domain-containing protein [Streptococcus sciuri]